ncbi:MAG: ABC transporter substrate-binding protein [Tractidigestivibacter sp.]|jgi:NitT/TauT family transport system substrate-binding protein|uniref:ABC transporter substrate-binding protein n=1 Tax=Tractidigestivibacter sp. TaxID=2847320 RepID=UPI003D8B1FC1
MLKDPQLTRRQALAALGSVSALALAACGNSSSDSSAADSSSASDASSSADADSASTEDVTVRVASLKGPTTIGLVSMMDTTSGVPTEDAPTEPAEGSTGITYSYTISGSADQVLPLVIQGETDIALVPSTAASVLYNKTSGGVRAIDVNTLGVLSVVTGDTSIEQFEDLAGHTVYLSGQGASPEYTLNYLLDQAGIADQVTVEFKSEHSECAAVLEADPNAIAILPEPFTTATLAKNSALSAPVSLTDVWNRFATDGSEFVLGVTVARTEFVDQYPDAIEDFLSRHAESVATVNADPAAAAPLVVKAGIVSSEEIAEQAIPRCNLVCTTGSEMRNALEGYLQVMYDSNESSVGGALPGDDFYYGA